jgi:ribosomal protein S18 acetylase RimI-like enzyme
MDINIRPCSPDGCGKALEIWDAAGNTPSVSDSIDALKQVMQTDSGLLLVAVHEGKIIGTVMGGWDGWRGNIYRLAVLPEYRRQGIARELIREIEKILADRGAKKISVLVEKEEELAAAFWDAMKNSDYNLDKRINRYAKSL